MAQLKFDLQLAQGDFQLDVVGETPLRGITGVFGPSGAGKTSFLRCLAGLEASARGSVSLGDEDWQNANLRRPTQQRHIGYVFQDARLFPNMSVRGNLEFGQRRSKIQHYEFESVVEVLGLDKLLEQSPSSLSGGESQRVALGRALLRSPELILMDEPLAALDAARREEVLPFLERAHAKWRTPILYVSHNIDEICRVCDRLLIVDAGRLLAAGELQQVLLHTDLPVLAGSEAGAVLRAKRTDYDERFDLSRIDTGSVELWVPGALPETEQDVRIRIRANDVSLCLERPEKTSILNVLPAEVRRISGEEGASSLLHLSIGKDFILARITRRSLVDLEIREGSKVYAQIKSIAVQSGRE